MTSGAMYAAPSSMTASRPSGKAKGHQRSPQAAVGDMTSNTPRPKKRNRAVLSCLSCHSRRVKCNRQHPCDTCLANGKEEDCTFDTHASRNNEARKGSLDESPESKRRASGNKADNPSPSQAFNSRSSYEQDVKGATPSSMGGQYPMSAFFTFVERFQQHTQTNDRDRIFESAYPSDVVATIDAVRNDLPTPECTRLLILFFFDNLEWSYESGDFDEMDQWLTPFLNIMSQSTLSSDKLVRGDVTKLCLIITIITTVIQSANEGLIRTYFLDSNISASEVKLGRVALMEIYDAHLRNLLDSATHQDGSSTDLIRSSLIYCFILKNEGRHYESSNEPFLRSISHLVTQEDLHLDPSTVIYTAEQRDSRRRLFWTFYCFDRMTAAHSGFPLSIADDQITTQEPGVESWSPVLGRRVNIFTIYRSRLCRIGGEMIILLMKDGVQISTIKTIDDRLMAWQAALPPELQANLSNLPPDLYQLRTLDLQRRMLLIVHHVIRSGLHRSCFFPTDTISMDQVRISRKICVDSAMSMIKIQEGLRLLLISEHHLRFFFLPYVMLESAITLVLTTLIEVGNVPLGSAIPDNINEYLKWSHRALNLLLSLPSDFSPAIQGARLLSRVLTKATQILDLHAQRKLTAMDSNSAIRDVLLDDQGRKISIPLHEGPNGSHSSYTNRTIASGSDTSHSAAKTPASLTSSSSFGDFSNTLHSATSDYLTAPKSSSKALPDYTTIPLSLRSKPSADANRNFYPTTMQAPSTSRFMSEEPTYADMGLDFFDTMANSLINPFSSEGDTLLMSQQQMQQEGQQRHQLLQQTPATPLIGMDDQMDMWLASLQTV